MKMTFRWYGNDDPISLTKIQQIPYIDGGIVSAVYDIKPGKIWTYEAIDKIVDQCQRHNLKFEVVESLPVHEDIKMGLATRDQYIENYKTSLVNLAKAGVKVVTYNFMPIWDWFRTTTQFEAQDKSKALAYDHQQYLKILNEFRNLNWNDASAEAKFESWKLPGWDTSFSAKEIGNMIKIYQKIDHQKLWENLTYFLHKIIPTAEKAGIKMAIHPDDPPWDLFDLPRIITNKENLARLLKISSSPSNGIALCTGSLGSARENDLADLVKTFIDRIYFAHLRNVKITGQGEDRSFNETAHHYLAGTNDQLAIMKVYVDCDYQYYIRSDHGRMIWNEEGKPGYGLFDRALGAAYLSGIIHGLKKAQGKISD